MFTDMDKIDDNKIMMNTMDYNPDGIEYDDEEIILQPNQINNSQGVDNTNRFNILEKLLLLALMLFGRHYMNVHF
tara:strand:+ start:4545 stop:4769 length:225 start_codon:yes stop_codon:yes gene_type:complete